DEQTPAVMSFLAGNSDAIVFASAPESPMVQMLLQTPGVKLLDFAQAEAYSRRFAYLSAVRLPRGIVNLAQDNPPQQVNLVATTTTLLVREDLHPALRQLLVQAARNIHGGPGWFNRAGEFPNANDNELPLDREAQRFYRDGPPLLQRYAPFWLANVVDRMWVVLLSITVVLVPLSRIVPPVYRFRIRSRIFRWYGQLRGIEERLVHGGAPHAELLRQLDQLDHKAEGIPVPLAYADELYALRSNIQLVRQRIAAAAAEDRSG
ncbi:MAG: C4-dicarboxylate ABC transporter substrate-binding protein, partial [Betaproteobacteria bacterium]|nr:C4-dicarboxylate ABC transporter substrate-binding protein [Betaproteobacteria bacterium]